MVRVVRDIVGVLFLLSASISLAADAQRSSEPIHRPVDGPSFTIDGHPIEITPRAIYVGRNGSLPREGRIVVVDLELTHTESLAIPFDAREAVLVLDGLPVAVSKSLAPFRNINFDYFEREYRVIGAGVEDDPRYWRVSNDEAFPHRSKLSWEDGQPKHPLLTGVIEPNDSARIILAFSGFPAGQNDPDVQLAWPNPKQPIDLAAWSTRRVQTSMSRVGPKGCVGVLTIDGPLDRLGLRVLNQGIDAFAAEDVRRVVFDFTSQSSFSESRLASWLKLSIANPTAALATYRDVPSLTPGVSPYIVADSADVVENAIGRIDPSSQQFIRSSLDEAIEKAVTPVASRLTRDDVIRELRNPTADGVVAAVLRAGAYRLRGDDLPLVLKLTDSNSSAVKRAAFAALAHFDAIEAVDRLIDGLKTDDRLTRREAVTALFTSRSEHARNTFDRLAAAISDDAKGLQQLAASPVDAWRPVFEQASRSSDIDLQEVGVTGQLNLGGQPVKPEIERILTGTDQSLKSFLVRELMSRDVAEWRDFATNLAMSQLRKKRVDGPIMELVVASERRDAVPLILEQLPTMSLVSGLNAMNALGVLASAEEESRIIELIPDLDDRLARGAVELLFERRSPERFDVARQLLDEAESAIRGPIVNLLAKDGSVEAEQFLFDEFIKSDDPRMWSQYSMRVAAIGGEKALQAIEKVLADGPDEKRVHALNARYRIWSRSAAARITVMAGITQQGTKEIPPNHPRAEELYKEALEIDPGYVPAYTQRAMLYLQWHKGVRLGDALADYLKADELATAHAAALIGMGLCYSSQGETGKAIDAVEAIPAWARELDETDEYNVACVYGILLQKVPPSDPQQLETWRVRGVESLETAIELGFRGDAQLEHMKKDPDLVAFHGPEFDRLLKLASGLDTGDSDARER